MIKEAPQKANLDEQLSNIDKIEDTVSVKDSSIYQIQKWEYLVKKQTTSGQNNLVMWFDELANQGWEIINRNQANLGFYIFKKPAKA